MSLLVRVAVLLLLASPAWAQAPSFTYYSPTGNGHDFIPWPGGGGGGGVPTPTLPTASTYQGTMTLSAATSTALTTANSTMNNSTVVPVAGAFGVIRVTNVGNANPAYVCWFGGTASATAGCELLLPNGGSDMINLTGKPNAPTLFSTLGTSLTFHD